MGFSGFTHFTFTVIWLSSQVIFSKDLVMKMRVYLLTVSLMFFSKNSYGRVFDFNMESIAPYFNVRTGMSQAGSDPYAWQTSTSYGGDEVGLMYGGEFGLYMRGGGFGFGLGLLVHTYDPVTGGTGSNAGGTQLFSVDSEGISYGGLVSFDMQLAQTKTYNWKVSLGGGYEFIKLENTYSYSTAGQALSGGQATAIESFKTAAPFVLLSVGTEFYLSGTTTMNVTAGYHYSMASDWKYGEGGNNFAGAHLQEGAAILEDGSARDVSWSYPFLQIGFQFYVDTVR